MSTLDEASEMVLSIHFRIIYWSAIFILVLSFDLPKIQVSPETQKTAVENLITRLLGSSKSTFFSVEIKADNKPTDSFTILKVAEDRIHISATSGVAAAYGFHFYLKYYCNCHISWDNDQLDLPSQLPFVNITVKSYDTYRYYQNVCTYSYSYVWWTWERWEREIDWMALNGINLALAFTAQEAIWLRVYQKLNFTQNEINENFAGPAFLAWQRMANIRGWGGPLFESWHQDQVALQHKILTRMKLLGIIPVLPAFCGHVPRALKRLYPQAKIALLPSWGKFADKYCCPYLLDHTEPLFDTLGQLFYQEQEQEFGISHFYNCDIFNELRPPYEDPIYLKNMTATVSRILSHWDDAAVWIMQGWLFASDPEFWTKDKVKHFLSGVPNNKMIVLDLQSEIRPLYEVLDWYFGKPFIWCMLHNFGGTLGMHGSFDILNTRVVEARLMINSTMVGVGITPEGINQNYVIYDFMTESSWRNTSMDVDLWVKKYCQRRYGNSNTNLQTVWKLLQKSVYNYKLLYPLHGQYTVILRPSTGHAPWSWYNMSDISTAWQFMLNFTHSDIIISNGNYQHDLLDITRQAMSNLFDKFYINLIAGYFKGNLPLFQNSSHSLLDLLLDLDLVLSTNQRFMLGPWLRDAKSKGTTLAETQILEVNARNQITLWGPNGEVRDYAAKQWAGLVKDYYYPRWKLFIDYLYKSLLNGAPFRQHIFDKNVFEMIEKPFTYFTKKYPCTSQNDTYIISEMLHQKWKRYLINS